MYYLLYRNRENRYTLCNNEGYMLTKGNIAYSATIEDACNVDKVQKDITPFHFNLSERWCGDVILWYYPLATLENPRQNYPELFI